MIPILKYYDKEKIEAFQKIELEKITFLLSNIPTEVMGVRIDKKLQESINDIVICHKNKWLGNFVVLSNPSTTDKAYMFCPKTQKTYQNNKSLIDQLCKEVNALNYLNQN